MGFGTGGCDICVAAGNGLGQVSQGMDAIGRNDYSGALKGIFREREFGITSLW